MDWSFLNNSARKRDQIVVVDLGAHTTKAVHMQRKGDQFTLLRYVLADNPARQNTPSPELLTEHIKSIVETLDAKTKLITLAVGVTDSVIRQTELPQIPVQDMRLVLKTSPKTYLQQDLPNHIFDCYIIPPACDTRQGGRKGGPSPGQPSFAEVQGAGGGGQKKLFDRASGLRDQGGLHRRRHLAVDDRPHQCV